MMMMIVWTSNFANVRSRFRI